AYSDDGGQTWTKDPHARWDNIFGLSTFQVSAMVPHEGHVYLFGTPSTRLGAVGLARVAQDQILNTTAYQYWRDGQWTPVGGAAGATPIVDAPVGELSVRYAADRGVWQMSYLDTARAAIVVRESATPQGAWSEPVPTVTVFDHAELYGGVMHPWSRGDELYFNITTRSDHNVYLMRAELSRARGHRFARCSGPGGGPLRRAGRRRSRGRRACGPAKSRRASPWRSGGRGRAP